MSDTVRQRVLSCTQPTGNLHIGRYFGAVRNWVELQSQYDCVYGIVNYHAMTMPFVPAKLREATWDLAYNLAAVGINPDNLFIQSLVPEHAELAWVFNCVTSYGELGRMVQSGRRASTTSSWRTPTSWPRPPGRQPVPAPARWPSFRTGCRSPGGSRC
jgi:tryptophanyl-tRNA synthetase